MVIARRRILTEDANPFEDKLFMTEPEIVNDKGAQESIRGCTHTHYRLGI